MNGVIYARYSSHAQNEQSIEGQLKECYRYAESNGIDIIREYIDRAQTGTNDNREQFQKMILDSKSGDFDTIIVYQLDRFARNRYDSAVNKAILKKNGVRVLSARENITDDASGILVEGILESLAEYYSAELSQKVRRGMLINAEKCQFNGGAIPFGYSIDKDKHYAINPDQAFIVVEVFERYLSGETIKSITDDLRVRQIKTNKGSYLDKSSIIRMLRNKRYTGSYIYAGIEIPNSIPAIVPKELFDKVQPMLDKNSHAPARRRDEDEYLLTTKLFCGKCKEMMVGYGGTSKNGNVYHYYCCKQVRRKKCDKKVISKKFAEDTVIKMCKKLLNDINIERIVAGIEEACNSDAASSAIRKLEKSLDDLNKSIDKLIDSIEQGVPGDMVAARIKERCAERDELIEKLETEKRKEFVLSAEEIKAFLYKLKNGNSDDYLYRRGLINIFVKEIYLYDDRMTIFFHGSEKPIVVTDILLENTLEYFGDSGCSSKYENVSPSNGSS